MTWFNVYYFSLLTFNQSSKSDFIPLKIYLQTIAAAFFSFLNLNFVSRSFKLGQMSHICRLAACKENSQNMYSLLEGSGGRVQGIMTHTHIIPVNQKWVLLLQTLPPPPPPPPIPHIDDNNNIDNHNNNILDIQNNMLDVLNKFIF